jgi:hypothetical protein
MLRGILKQHRFSSYCRSWLSLRIVLEDNGIGLSGLAGFGMRGSRAL